MMEIRRINENELQSVVKLATGIYEYCTRPQVKDSSMVQQFYDYMKPESILMQAREGRLLIWGAIEGQTLCAAGAMQSDAHITMLYVHPYYQKRGIGTALLKEMKDYAMGVLGAYRVTVHAIPAAAAGFFVKNGFMQMQGVAATEDFCPLECRFAVYQQPTGAGTEEKKSPKAGTMAGILFVALLLATLTTVLIFLPLGLLM